MMILVTVTNVLVAVISGVSCLVGLVRPTFALPTGEEVTSGAMFFVGAYAARALPLSLATLVLLAVGSTPALAAVLVVAGLAQLGDAVLGGTRGNVPMALSCVALALIPLTSAAWLLYR